MRLFLLSFSFFLAVQTFAQEFSIKGKILDEQSQEVLVGAHLSLMHPWGEAYKTSVSNVNGRFEINGVTQGGFKLEISYVGYTTFTLEVTISDQSIDLGNILLTQGTALDEIEVTAKIPLAEQKGDTTQYNADAYKVLSDASAEELVEKMPGVVIQNGKIQAQGEEVKEVLVDGKPFFGNDPQAALKNLPAEVISKIQVYDQTSEQASFSGFQDGETTKTINIITRPEMRNGQFGKAYAGYGYEDKYQAGGNGSFFNGNQRISIIAQTNNINQQNFSSEDLLGVTGSSGGRRGGRGGGGRRGGRGGGTDNFLVEQQGGIATTNAIGLNYSDNWGKNTEVSASYFLNHSDIESAEVSKLEYINNETRNDIYREDYGADTRNLNHRFNMRLQYKIDSLNEISIRPRLSIQQNKGLANTFGQSLSGTDLLSQTQNIYASELSGINFSNSLNYRRRLNKPGRTISLDFRQGYNSKNGDSQLTSEDEFYIPNSKVDTLDQNTELDIIGWNLSSNFTFTEPLGERSRLMLMYRYSVDEDESDRQTFDFEESTASYSSLNEALSNIFENNYTTHRAGAGYNYSKGRSFTFMARANVQWARLQSDELFPMSQRVDQSFVNVLPMIMLRFRQNRTENLRVFYMGRTQSPSVEQLQNVIDNSNPLQISIGNPKLDQAYTHRFSARYSKTNTEKATVFYFMLNSSYADNYIANATYLRETENPIFNEITLERGVQLQRPVNLSGYWTNNLYSTYGFPLKHIKSNLNIDVNAAYNRIPGLINDQKNQSDNRTIGAGFSLSSNISDKVDFTISTRISYNDAANSLQTAADADYLNQNSKVKFNIVLPKGLVFRTNLSHQYFSGLNEGFDDDFFLWSAGIGKKLFKNERGELTLSIFDLLEQNQSITRNVTETYIEDLRALVLQRYVMLTFAYNFRNFNTGKQRSGSRDNDRGDRPRRRFGD